MPGHAPMAPAGFPQGCYCLVQSPMIVHRGLERWVTSVAVPQQMLPPSTHLYPAPRHCPCPRPWPPTAVASLSVSQQTGNERASQMSAHEQCRDMPASYALETISRAHEPGSSAVCGCQNQASPEQHTTTSIAPRKSTSSVGTKQGWSQDEDNCILRFVSTHGQKWSLLASELPGRTDDAVRNRFLRLFKKVKGSGVKGAKGVNGTPEVTIRGAAVDDCTAIKTGEMWTSEEDRRIKEGVATFGLKWQLIAERLPGRSANAVRNRYLRNHSSAPSAGEYADP